ncbi:hypothetical protein [Embleya sp. NBC_00896]|uniref:hypothetical protein n=1 Tax=Embleya sp. NBC_00896 TaxID=2975961 RepID=UPI002F908475|nr:hypothetical protein OG928_48090 [Embleya sp. NBC_00896]
MNTVVLVYKPRLAPTDADRAHMAARLEKLLGISAELLLGTLPDNPWIRGLLSVDPLLVERAPRILETALATAPPRRWKTRSTKRSAVVRVPAADHRLTREWMGQAA